MQRYEWNDILSAHIPWRYKRKLDRINSGLENIMIKDDKLLTSIQEIRRITDRYQMALKEYYAYLFKSRDIEIDMLKDYIMEKSRISGIPHEYSNIILDLKNGNISNKNIEKYIPYESDLNKYKLFFSDTYVWNFLLESSITIMELVSEVLIDENNQCLLGNEPKDY